MFLQTVQLEQCKHTYRLIAIGGRHIFAGLSQDLVFLHTHSSEYQVSSQTGQQQHVVVEHGLALSAPLPQCALVHVCYSFWLQVIPGQPFGPTLPVSWL